MDRFLLTDLDRYFLHNTLPHLALRGALDAASNATSHSAVHAAICRLLLLLRSAPGAVLEQLEREAWLAVFERYLRVQPTVSADFELLRRILDLLEAFMTAAGPHHLPQSFRKWLLRQLRPPGPQGGAEGPLRLLVLRGERLVGETDSARLAEKKRWMAQRAMRFYARVISYLSSPVGAEMDAEE